MNAAKNVRRIVLVGTGTDVGKTYVGSQLARVWKEARGPVLGLKPIESGVVQSQKELQGDAASLGAGATESRWPRYALKDPISPHLAARREGMEIQTAEVANWVQRQEQEFAQAHEGDLLSIVETAGGAFSPVNARETNVDLARALDPAFWILVAPDALGVLHDVQATLRAIGDRVVDLVVLSTARGDDSSTGLNGPELENVVWDQLGSLRPRCNTVPIVNRGGDAAAVISQLISL